MRGLRSKRATARGRGGGGGGRAGGECGCECARAGACCANRSVSESILAEDDGGGFPDPICGRRFPVCAEFSLAHRREGAQQGTHPRPPPGAPARQMNTTYSLIQAKSQQAFSLFPESAGPFPFPRANRPFPFSQSQQAGYLFPEPAGPFPFPRVSRPFPFSQSQQALSLFPESAGLFSQQAFTPSSRPRVSRPFSLHPPPCSGMHARARTHSRTHSRTRTRTRTHARARTHENNEKNECMRKNENK